MLLVINDSTTKPLVDQLINRYPYLQKKRNHLTRIIIDFLGDSPHYRNLCLTKFANSVIKNIEIGINNPKIILTTHNKISFNETYKYDAYYQHDFSNFQMIRWAAKFYGKSIDELATDAMKMCNYKHTKYSSISKKICWTNLSI